MKAIQELDGTLVWTDAAAPEPGPGEVRISVRATAVNRADLVQRAGRYAPPPGASQILGLECAGVIDAVGAGVTDRSVGDEVAALLAGGGYASQVCCPASHTLPKGSLSWTEAAAVVEVFATAWLNLRVEGGLQEGEQALVHAAGSGVGTAALQLCRAWGNPVFATASAGKEERCRSYGAGGFAVRGDFTRAVNDWGGADVALCPVGGAYLESNLRCLRLRGRLVIIGLLGGREAMLPLGRLLVKRLTVRGSVLRSRSIDEKNTVIQGLREQVWPLLQDGRLSPVIDRVLPVEKAEEAHAVVASNQTVGKVVLSL